ncbi:nucleotidyltransferase domain-containing protein [Alienimonas californiensis]|uniref:Putative nucleotidyltransferase n=1 Tax=Alienimonas californiensis TaxID=2527989 RepID=A0A517PE69_9PLAN|nr:nucleotidyltransferase domain-containing protein [Alienimonas californiensis]QDT17675.1 putative nucleotidyltransferase [Alienimonas californiensis]
MRSPLFDRQILRVVIGSRAYGLDDEGSDTDRRGVFLPPAAAHWSLEGVPDVLRDDDQEEMAWELARFLRLALKGNPTVLEVLFTPLVEYATPLGRELLGLRTAFLSKRLHGTCGGYADQQFAKLQRRADAHRPLNWKHAAHCLRLLATGAKALAGDGFPVSVGPHRDVLLSVRRGEKSLEEVDDLAAEWRSGLDRALRNSPLPDEPDAAAVDAFLIHARRRAADSDALP